MARSIATKISLAAVLLTMAVVLILGAASYIFNHNYLKYHIQEKLSFEVALISNRMETGLNGINNDVLNMSKNLVFVNALVDSEGREMYVEPLLHSYHLPQGIPCTLTLCDFSGKAIISNQETDIHSYTDKTLLTQAITKQQPLARITFSEEERKLLIAHPVFYGATSMAEGIFILELPVLPFVARYFPQLTDASEVFYSLSTNNQELWTTVADRTTPMLSSSIRLNLPSPLDQLNLALTVSQRASKAYSSLSSLAGMYGVLGVLVLLLVIIGAQITGRKLAAPIISLTKTANRIAHPDFPENPLTVAIGNETTQLTSAFNIMLTRLQEAQATLEAKVIERTAQLSTITQNLKDSENKFRTIANYTYAWEVWEDPQGKCLYCSPSCQRITGYTVEDFLADPDLLERLILPDDLPRWKAHCSMVHNDSDETSKTPRNPADEVDFRIFHADGEVRWISHTCYPIHDENNRNLGHRISNRDITDRKNNEQQIKKLAQELQTILDTLTVGVVSVHNRRIQWANRALEKMFGYTLEEDMGSDTLKYYADENEYKRVGKAYAQLKDGSCSAEVWMKAKDGRLFWCNMTGRAINPAAPMEGSIWMFQDITEQKAATERLRTFAETQTVLLREVNHRVKNNLVAIISMLHQEEDLAQEKGALEYQGRIKEVIWRITGLLTVHRLLSSSEWQPLSLSELCTSVIEETLKGANASRSLHLTVSPSTVRVDSDQAHSLTIILNELCTNSIKYASHDHNITHITVSIGQQNNIIELTYQDDGPGFPESLLHKDFTSRGIGIKLINGLVTRNLQGTIILMNENGAVAHISFPAVISVSENVT